MTTPDRCREEFEKWVNPKWSRDRTENGLYASPELAMAYRVWQAATQAAARRCVEICRDRLSACVAGDLIEQEFGLQGE